MILGILPQILSKEHRDAGLFLEQDDHLLFLNQINKLLPVAVFSATGATIEEILYEADQALNWIKSKIEFVRIKR